MIWYFTPYSLDKNLGKAYNDYVRCVPSDDDWIALVDADTMWLRPDFGHQLEEIISANPCTGMFTCWTNRVGNIKQRYTNMWGETDILRHRRVATHVQQKFRTEVIDLNVKISGHLMLFKKQTWKDVGGFSEDLKILGVDNDFSYRILKKGLKIQLMKGVYLLHYYRMAEGRLSANHLK